MIYVEFVCEWSFNKLHLLTLLVLCDQLVDGHSRVGLVGIAWLKILILIIRCIKQVKFWKNTLIFFGNSLCHSSYFANSIDVMQCFCWLRATEACDLSSKQYRCSALVELSSLICQVLFYQPNPNFLLLMKVSWMRCSSTSMTSSELPSISSVFFISSYWGWAFGVF